MQLTSKEAFYAQQQHEQERLAERKQLEAQVREFAEQRLRRNRTLQASLEHFELKMSQFAEKGLLAKVLPHLEKELRVLGALRKQVNFLEQLVYIDGLAKAIREALLAGEVERALGVLEQLTEAPNLPSLSILTDHHAKLCEWASGQIGKHLDSEISQSLAAAGWPKAVPSSRWDSIEIANLARAFELTLLFGRITAVADPYRRAMKTLLLPITVQFNFHFATDRPTNRLDRPTWPLEYLQQVVQTHRDFIISCLDISSGDACPALGAFAQGITEIAHDLMATRLPSVVTDAFLLQKYVLECIGFSSRLQEATGSAASRLLRLFLGDGKDVENLWLQNERDASCLAFNMLIKEESGSDWLVPCGQTSRLVLAFIALVGKYVDLVGSLAEFPTTQVRLFTEVLVPLLESFYEKVDFDIPSFHTTPRDIESLMALANSLQNLLNVLKNDFGSRLDMLALAGTREFASVVDYDVLECPGAIFSKSIEAFEGLLAKICSHLLAFLWEPFAAGVLAYSGAMVYSQQSVSTGMHDEMRRALVTLAESMRLLKSKLSDPVHELVQDALIRRLDGLFFDRVALENFFSEAGCVQFAADMKVIVQSLTGILGRGVRLGRTMDAARLLASDQSQLKELCDSLCEEDMERVSSFLQAIGITNLTVSECEQLTSLLR